MTQTIDDHKGLSKKMQAAHLRKTLERRNGANSYICRLAATMSDELFEHLEREAKRSTT